MKPDCFKCVHHRSVPGDCHLRCNNLQAKVTGNPHGIRRGWFTWPLNFDPVWLKSCDGFSDKPEDNKPESKTNPLLELAALLTEQQKRELEAAMIEPEDLMDERPYFERADIYPETSCSIPAKPTEIDQLSTLSNAVLMLETAAREIRSNSTSHSVEMQAWAIGCTCEDWRGIINDKLKRLNR